MANYQSQYTGEQIDEAVGKALAGGTSSGGGTKLYKHRTKFDGYSGFVYFICDSGEDFTGKTIVEINNIIVFCIPYQHGDYANLTVLGSSFDEDTMSSVGAIIRLGTSYSKTVVTGACTSDTVTAL